jgi:hypothetical protein
VRQSVSFPGLELFTFPFKAMGSPCELRLYAADERSAKQVADGSIAEVHRLEKNILVIVTIVSSPK